MVGGELIRRWTSFAPACFPQHFDYLLACGAPDNGIVNNNKAFAFNKLLDRVQLDLHAKVPDALLRLDKGPADIMISYKTKIKGYAAFFRVTYGSRNTGVRHRDDQVCIHL